MRQGIFQEAPEPITYTIKEYLPETGVFVNIIRNETRSEEYERKGYIYTASSVHLAMEGILELDQHIAFEVDQYVDIFFKPN